MPSNGQLLAMSGDERAATIEGLSSDVRRKLAHIATLGAEHDIKRAIELLGEDASWFAGQKLRHAAELSALAAQLTADSMRGGA